MEDHNITIVGNILAIQLNKYRRRGTHTHKLLLECVRPLPWLICNVSSR